VVTYDLTKEEGKRRTASSDNDKELWLGNRTQRNVEKTEEKRPNYVCVACGSKTYSSGKILTCQQPDYDGEGKFQGTCGGKLKPLIPAGVITAIKEQEPLLTIFVEVDPELGRKSSLQIHEKTKDRLRKLGFMGESFEEVIVRLIDYENKRREKAGLEPV